MSYQAMGWAALAIIASTVLYLVDKNGIWSNFRRFAKRSVIAALIVAGAVIALAMWQDHQYNKAFADQPLVKWDH